MRVRPALGLVAIATAASSVAAQPIDRKALALIEHTRETQATYSVFNWNWITTPGEPGREEWSAEFHHGKLHRVETPGMRLVADCEKQTGTYLDVATGERGSGPQVAGAACGIHDNARIEAATITGRKAGRFGTAIELEIRDPDHLRTYSVVENGALVGATISDPSGRLLVRAEAMVLRDTVPDGIFSPRSLAKSAVPERYRQGPAE
jgi:hypothetical protein